MLVLVLVGDFEREMLVVPSILEQRLAAAMMAVGVLVAEVQTAVVISGDAQANDHGVARRYLAVVPLFRQQSPQATEQATVLSLSLSVVMMNVPSLSAKGLRV